MNKKENLLAQGVKILDLEHTYIDDMVEVGPGCTIYPNVFLRGETKIGSNNVIRENTTISNCEIGSHNQIVASTLADSSLGSNNQVGPFTNIHSKTVIGNGNHLGNYVEIKESVLGNDNFVKHLSYLGNARLGDCNNLGASTITANCQRNCTEKQQTEIGDDNYIGSHVTLVAPIKIGSRTVVGAGSVITDDVPDNSLGIARSRQTTRENYYEEIV